MAPYKVDWFETHERLFPQVLINNHSTNLDPFKVFIDLVGVTKSGALFFGEYPSELSAYTMQRDCPPENFYSITLIVPYWENSLHMQTSDPSLSDFDRFEVLFFMPLKIGSRIFAYAHLDAVWLRFPFLHFWTRVFESEESLIAHATHQELAEHRHAEVITYLLGPSYIYVTYKD